MDNNFVNLSNVSFFIGVFSICASSFLIYSLATPVTSSAAFEIVSDFPVTTAASAAACVTTSGFNASKFPSDTNCCCSC
jgi:hypothetical protein